MTYAKTDAGQVALKERAFPLTPRQRTAFILFDGKRSLADVIKAAGIEQADIDLLVAEGFIASVGNPISVSAAAAATPAPGSPAGAAPTPAPSTATEQERYARAYPIAAQLTSSLGLRGFRLNLAIEGVGNLADLIALAPKIHEAVGNDKYRALHEALNA
jgi:hypothetical protein